MDPEVELRYDVAKGRGHLFDLDDDKWPPFKALAMRFVTSRWLNEREAND